MKLEKTGHLKVESEHVYKNYKKSKKYKINEGESRCLTNNNLEVRG